jgi:DNA invertase Pin-like site-specific DNA recombinase
MSCQLFVAYFRIGTGRHGRFDFGLGVQHRAVAEYLDGGERDLVGIYTEIESGERCNRPELARALEACRRQKATLIVVRLDSLARDAGVLLAILDAAADCEVVFCDPSQGSPGRTGRAHAALATSAAEPETDLNSRGERPAWRTAGGFGNSVGWAAAALHDAQKATSPGTTVNRRLADHRAAEILPVIRALQASGIRTLQGLANALNARGVRTARGARWYPTTVRNVLRRKLSGAQQAVDDPECLSAISARHAGSNECRPVVLELVRPPIGPLCVNS